MRDRGKPSEVIGEIGHSGYLTKTSATDSAASPSRAATIYMGSALGRCRACYASGEFVGAQCIERAKEERHGLGLCRVHVKVFDCFLAHGFDYARSIVKYEWGVDLDA